MTAVVGFTQYNWAYIGADSSAISNTTVNPRLNTKVFGVQAVARNASGWGNASSWEEGVLTRTDGKLSMRVVFGFSTSFRIGQVLQYKFAVGSNFPELPGYPELLSEFMATEFVDYWKRCARDNGVVTMINGMESCGDFMVGIAGRLFTVYKDFQVAESVSGYEVIGMEGGRNVALGAMHALERLNPFMGPKIRMRAVLEAASYHCTNVCPPFHMVSNRTGGEYQETIRL